MHPAIPTAADPVLHVAIRRILAGEALEPFCEWFSHEMGAAVQAEHPLPPDEVADGIRYQRHVARTLWQSLPVPGNRWRPRPLPRIERNGPCPCGSGRKYKQCCAEFAGLQAPGDATGMYVLALSLADPSMLQPRQAREVPPEALAMAAQSWNEEGMPERTVAVLEPLFESVAALDHRHEMAFDMLMDALQALGQEARRDALARRTAQSRDKNLACAARCSLVSMLADRGEWRAAWALFHEAQRLHPDNPQLWHLELTLLHAEGRAEEARMRGTLLAARAHKAGDPELARMLADLGSQGLASLHAWADDDEELDDAEDEAWAALCAQVPEEIDAEACARLYETGRDPAHAEDAPPVLHIAPTRELAELQGRWSRRFGVSKPALTQLQGDADALLGELPEAAQFLRDHPTAWLSIEVLDDLLLAAADIADPDAPAPVLRGARRLAAHAVAVLHAIVGQEPAQLLWMETGSRPPLRVLAQAIAFAQEFGDTDQVEQLAAWSLRLNPTDNHGWRAALAPLLLDQQRHAEALDLLERYPGDMPPAEHVRALALFALGRRQEAEAALRPAHAKHPRLVEALLPEVMDAPPAEDGPGLMVGGAEQAWEHRNRMRGVWVRTGALAWLRELDLPAPPATPAPGKQKSSARRTRGGG